VLQSRSATALAPPSALDQPSWARGLLALAVALLAQSTVLHAVHVHGGTLSLTFLVVAWFAIASGTARGALFGLVAGALEDGLCGATGAAWTLATPAAAAVAARVVRGTRWDHPAFVGPVVAAATLLRTVLFWLVSRAEGHVPVLDAAAGRGALWTAVLTGAMAVAVAVAFPKLRAFHAGRT
jgi:rod shape-determining protein MreD